MILIVIIGKECIVFEVAELTALLMLVMNHRGRTADVPALLLLHLLFEASLMLHLLIVQVVVAVVPLLVVLLFVLLAVVDLLHILIFLICIFPTVVDVTPTDHILVVVSLMMQQLHVLFKVWFAFCNPIVRVLDWRTLLDHLVLSGLLLLGCRGLFGGGRDIDGEAVKVERGHSVRSRLDVHLEQVEPRVARLTVKSNIALTFHVLILLGWVVVAQVSTSGVAHSPLSRVVEQLVTPVAVRESARGDGLDLCLEDLVDGVASLVQLEDEIHELSLFVAGVPIKSKGR